jgi:hypothetical protein
VPAVNKPGPAVIRLPFEPGPYRMTMGLVGRDPTEMIEIDDRYLPEMALRRQLLAERHNEVFVVTPGSEPARHEVLTRLAALLPARFPAWFAVDNMRLHNHLTGESWNLANLSLDPLEIAACLVQEDLCVIRHGATGPVLAAAVVCFPTRWVLAEKIGRPLAAVHEPVPLYRDRLRGPVDRFMTHLKPGRLAERANWSVLDDAALFQPVRRWRGADDPPVTSDNAGETLVLRTERQTLSALPERDTVLFTIRVQVSRLAEVLAYPGVAARLAEAVRSLPPEIETYKRLTPFRAALLSYLDRRGGRVDDAGG